MKLSKLEHAPYTLAMELWNAISHGLGALFGVVVIVLTMLKINGVYPYLSYVEHDVMYVMKMVTCLFYGISIIVCMTVSCVYHSLAKNKGKKVMRIIDHAMIYLLVAGSYAPFCLVGMIENEALLWNIPGTWWSGYLIFALSYVFIAIGVTFSSINMVKFSVLSMVMYLLGGGAIILNVTGAYSAFGLDGFLYLVFGGVAFFIGAALYGVGKKKSLWWHTVFHFFILAGIILHFLAIYLAVL